MKTVNDVTKIVKSRKRKKACKIEKKNLQLMSIYAVK